MRLILFVALVVVLAVTNPGPDEFAEFAEDNVTDEIATNAGGLLGEIGGLAAGTLVRRFADRDNYVVASMYTLDFDGRAREGEEWKFLGIATLFFEIQRPTSID